MTAETGGRIVRAGFMGSLHGFLVQKETGAEWLADLVVFLGPIFVYHKEFRTTVRLVVGYLVQGICDKVRHRPGRARSLQGIRVNFERTTICKQSQVNTR